MKRNTLIKHCLFILFLSFFISQAKTQDSLSAYTDISKVVIEKFVTRNLSTAIVKPDFDVEHNFQELIFTPGVEQYNPLPLHLVGSKFLVRIQLKNASDTSKSVFLNPGFYFQDMVIYRMQQNIPVKIPDVYANSDDSIGYRLITLAAYDTATYIVALIPVKTYNSNIRLRVIGQNHVAAFVSQLNRSYDQKNLINYVFTGLLLMMILFSLTNYFQGGNKEFLYYSCYAFFLGGLLFFQNIFHFHASRFSYFFEGYFDFIMQCVGIIFYMLFMRKFLNTKKEHPFLYKLYNWGIIFIISALCLYTILHYFSTNYTLEYYTENSTKIILLALTIIFLNYCKKRWDEKLLHYLFWGNLFLLIFSIFSQIGVMTGDWFRRLPGLLHSSVIYYEIGLFLELVFFLAGLNYKNRRNIVLQTKEKETLKAQNLLKEYEKEIAVYKAQQEERQRISADMHDELGAGMTAIRLMSEIAKNKMKENTPVEINKISQSANDVLNKMNAIIWSMNTGNDTLDNLISYIRAYSLEYFDGTSIDCKVITPDEIPEKELTGDKRRNIFLCVKETLNNALKHANATQVTITIETHTGLLISIKDNGKGIDLDKIRQFGNGLKNIKRRMESIGGSLTIENENGTVTIIRLPY